MNTKRLIALLLISLHAAHVQAADKEVADRPAIIAALERNEVNVNGLALDSSQGGPSINLGTGPNGGKSTNCNDENLALVAQLPEIERIFLFKGSFTKLGLGKLAALPKLKQLQIYAPSQVSPDVFAVLAEIRSLESLIFGEYLVTDEMLGYMEKIPGLRSLEITKSEKVSPQAVARLLAATGDMENFLLMGDALDNEGVKLLGQKKSLRRLMINSKKITAEAWSELAGLTNMRTFDVRGTTFDDAGMRVLEGMNDLEVLMLRETQITDSGMKSIAGLTKLADLGLDGTRITDAGMVHLKNLTGLNNLYVSHTDVGLQGLAFVPRKDQMVMMSTGREALSPKQFTAVTGMFPGTQIFDTVGYWRPERVAKAREEMQAASPEE